MTVVELWVQAEVLPVRLRLVPAGGTGHLETLTLRAIKAGVDDVDSLADIFGIPPRVVLDMVGDLWREERVALDIGAERETIVVTSKAIKELENLDKHGSLPSGYKVSDSHQVLLEKLTGRLLPLRSGRNYPDDRSLVVPSARDDPTRANIDHNALVSAAMAGMEDRRRSRKADELNGMRVADAMLAPESSSVTGVRYVRMTAQISLSARDELVVAVDDENLPLAARQVATRRLTALLSSDPSPPLANRLRSLAVRAPYQPRDVSQVVAELGRAADGLPGCAPANRQRQQDMLVSNARDVFQHVDSLAWQEMDVRLVQTEGEHREAILSLIRDTSHQAVIAVPWVRERGLRPYLDALTQAVKRGVKVFLLWGIREAGETLDDPVRRQLLTLQREADAAGRGGGIHVPELPSYLHAKVVVSDDRRALVTSRNFFGESNLKELGAVLTATQGQPAPLIEDLLRWAHRVIPNAAIAGLLAQDRLAFGTPEYHSALPPVLLPQLTAALTRAAPNSALAQSWCEAWRAVVADLGRLLQRERPVVSLVTDGYHRTLMHHALEQARRRVVIASDGFSTNAVTTGLVAAAREAAARGVCVSVVYARGRDEGAAERVAELKRPEPGTPVPVVRQVTGHHAKVMIRDNSVVVGSFNYLSLDSSRRRGRSTGEVSVLIESPPVSDAVTDLLERSPREPGTVAPATVNVTDVTVLAPSVAVALAAQRALESLAAPSGIADPDTVAASLLDSGAPDQVVELLGSLASDLEVERVLAALVYAGPEPDGAWHGWLQGLVGSGWRRGAWWVAHQLRGVLPLGADVPSQRLTAAAAAADSGELAGLLTGFSTDGTIPPQERDALCLLGVVQLLRTADLELQEPLRRWEGACSPVIQAPVRTVLSGVARYGALPRAELVEIVRNREATAQLGLHWQALDHAAHELRRYKPNTPPGDQLLASLFGTGEMPDDPAHAAEMAELELIAAERDVDRLGRWFEQYREVDDARWVDRAGSRAGLARPIDGSQRTSFILKRAAIRQAVEDVRAAAQDIRSVADLDPGQLGVIETLVTQLSRVRDEAAPGWAGDLVRGQVGLVMAEINGESLLPVAGATAEAWRFPRSAVARQAPETPAGVAAVRLLAADLCSAWSPSSALGWLAEQGEYLLAGTVRGALLDARLISTAEAEALAAQADRHHAGCVSEMEDAWSLLRARADRAGVGMPPEWEEWRGTKSIARRQDAKDALRRAQNTVDGAIKSMRDALEKALRIRRDALAPDWAERIERLIGVGELVAAGRALEEDDGVGVVPVIERGRAWPYRHMPLQTVVYQLGDAEHRYPLVRNFIPSPGDVDGMRLVTALRSLEVLSEQAVRDYVEAVQLLIADPGIPRRLRPATPDPVLPTATAAPECAPSGMTAHCYAVDLVLPHPFTLPSLSWTGRDVVAAVGDCPVPGTLFRLSLQMSAPRSGGPVVDVSSILSLLAPDGDRVASRQLRSIRLLRAICSDLPLKAVADAQSLGPLDSADARVRLWTLLHVLGFEMDEVARASLFAAAGDYPHFLWHLIDTALRDRRNPDIDSAHLMVRWDTAQLIARDDFDALVRKAVNDDLPDRAERAVLAAIALMGRDARATPEDVAGYVTSGASSHADQEALAVLVDSAAVGRHMRALQGQRYVTLTPEGHASVRESVVGRSIIRFEPAQWLEETASELLKQVSDPEAALVRELSHSLVQSYRLAGDDPQRLGPRDLRDPGVPCWANRWAAIVVSRSGIQELYPQESISVTHDLAPDLWVAGPSVAFALILDNLIHNARAAVGLRTMDNPGRILISAHAEAGSGMVRIEVSDNGPGLPEDVAAAILSGQYCQQGNRGYGLSDVVKRVTDHGWRLDIDRHPRLGGARIIVRIPQVTSPSQLKAASG